MIRWLFSRLWRQRLAGRRLIRVTGWRSCILEKAGTRDRVTFCVWGPS